MHNCIILAVYEMNRKAKGSVLAGLSALGYGPQMTTQARGH